MQLRKIWASARDSLWFLPSLWVLGCGALAFILMAVDSATPNFASDYPLVFGGGAEGARGLLSSIASSMITVAGVTFSITLVALQLASSQFSPRVLRNFMSDRVTQVVLGSFIGTFTYAILVLRSIRTQAVDTETFVPSLSVSVGIVLALVAVGMLVFFIHHMATQIQISTIIATIADETTERIRAEWREEEEDPDSHDDSVPERPAGVVTARRSGNLQLVDHEGLGKVAAELLITVRLEVRSGEWVQEGTALFSVWPSESVGDELADRLSDQLTVGDQRSLEQDAAFGIRQLVDVALRAISPGINDPTSAAECIQRIGQLLVAAGTRRQPESCVHDDDGSLRVLVPQRDFGELVALAFDQVRQYGHGNADVLVTMLETLYLAASALPSARRVPLQRQANLIGKGLDAIPIDADRERVVAAIEKMHAL
ncbi:MAG: DUF2254 domain-containing protein [Candidatus Limnocylindrales bacterium]